MYREVLLLADLGWVDFDLVCSIVCPIWLGQIVIWQNWLCIVGQDVVTSKIYRTQVHEQMDVLIQ